MHRLEDRVVVALGLEPGERAEGAGGEHLQVRELSFADRDTRDVSGLVRQDLCVGGRNLQVHQRAAVRRDGGNVVRHGSPLPEWWSADRARGGYGTRVSADRA